MPKAESSKDAAVRNSGRRALKSIQKTTDLLKKSIKGKERATASLRPLPDSISVERFAETRAAEIFAFQNAIKTAGAQANSRVFQSLPRHLRRRAASHNPRRVPKRLQSRASIEIAPGDNVAKVQRKKARLRAKGNLRGESRTEQMLKRQLDKKWLATHIYHAKRFHMINLWGYRLPLTPTLKSFRPAYRASRRGVIVHDMSYHGVIELEGNRADLKRVLSLMAGGAFAGSKFETGRFLVETTLFRPTLFPEGLIGPAQILWHPDGDRLWIRVHPCIHQDVWDAISSLAGDSVRVTDLRDELAGFELVGPKGGTLLSRIFKTCRGQRKLDLGNPQTLPRGSVMAYQVYDPRLRFPSRTPHNSSEGSGAITRRTNTPVVPPALSNSALWLRDERLASPTFRKSDLDRRRQKHAVPGTSLRPTAKDDRIPLLVISLGDRYLVLFPPAWSMPILQTIVYTGTLIGGLEERRAQFREMGQPSFPEHFGATCKAGRDWEISQAEEEEARWRRKPPGKRVQDPTFKPAWNEILPPSSEEASINALKSDTGIWVWPSELNAFVGQTDVLARFRAARGMTPRNVDLDKAVVMIKLEMVERGSPGSMSAIYAQGDERLFGYTTTGNYSLTRGHGWALGLITLAGYQESGGTVRVKKQDGVLREARAILV